MSYDFDGCGISSLCDLQDGHREPCRTIRERPEPHCEHPLAVHSMDGCLVQQCRCRVNIYDTESVR